MNLDLFHYVKSILYVLIGGTISSNVSSRKLSMLWYYKKDELVNEKYFCFHVVLTVWIFNDTIHIDKDSNLTSTSPKVISEADKKSFSFRSFHRRYFVSQILKGEFNICLEDTHRKLFYWQYKIDHYKIVIYTYTRLIGWCQISIINNFTKEICCLQAEKNITFSFSQFIHNEIFTKIS